MIAKVASGGLRGVDAFRVDLEVDFARQGIPAFTMVGMAETAVREAHARVFAAMRASGFRMPTAGRVTVNLAPAGLRKTGTAYDLPLAVGLLASSGVVDGVLLDGWFFAGELSLDGAVRPVPGVLPLAVLARAEHAKGIIVSPDNAAEASIVRGLPVFAPRNLRECIQFLCGDAELAPVPEVQVGDDTPAYGMDFAEVKGQSMAKRALEVAAAGGHNTLLIGPPGSGKTMLAQRLPTILPPLNFDEALEITKIYSVAGLLPQGRGLVSTRPFRSPHHTISEAALVGGGQYPHPGEVSLAHRGVLFLDELPEYQKQTLEVLRQPLEDGVVSIARATQSVQYPASCMLVAAMNPCPCGYLTDPKHECTCSASQIAHYRGKLSGPLLDRIDVHMEVPAVSYDDLRDGKGTATSAEMRAHVLTARAIQNTRYIGTKCRCNAELSGSLLEQHCVLDAAGHELLRSAVQALGLSARAYTRILRLARTIADIAEEPKMLPEFLAEAISLRVLDRGE